MMLRPPQILRVDHAGEFGADRIYAGQMFVLGKTEVGDLIQEMWDQEKEHKVNMKSLARGKRIHPSSPVLLRDVV